MEAHNGRPWSRVFTDIVKKMGEAGVGVTLRLRNNEELFGKVVQLFNDNNSGELSAIAIEVEKPTEPHGGARIRERIPRVRYIRFEAIDSIE